jgi:acetolactate synthase-1/2/3 large subunit
VIAGHQVLHEETKGDAIITTGVGQHQMWAAQYYKFDKPRQWATSGGLGSMGFGLPSALGAAVAFDGSDGGRPKKVRNMCFYLLSCCWWADKRPLLH